VFKFWQETDLISRSYTKESNRPKFEAAISLLFKRSMVHTNSTLIRNFRLSLPTYCLLCCYRQDAS